MIIDDKMHIIMKYMFEHSFCKYSELVRIFARDISNDNYVETNKMTRKTLKSKVRYLLKYSHIISHGTRTDKGQTDLPDIFTVNKDKLDSYPELIQKDYQHAIQHKMYLHEILKNSIQFPPLGLIGEICDYDFKIDLLEDSLKYIYNNIKEFDNIPELRSIGMYLLSRKVLYKQALDFDHKSLEKVRFNKIEEIYNYKPKLYDEVVSLINEKLKEYDKNSDLINEFDEIVKKARHKSNFRLELNFYTSLMNKWALLNKIIEKKN